MIDYSIIIPVYCNEDTLNELMDHLDKKVFKKNTELNGQVVFCDDGSTDNSYEKLIKIKGKYPSTKIIKLTKNFGQIPAVISVLENIESKSYIVVSADLQDPIGLINEFLFYHFNEKYQIVAGERENRDESWLKKLGPKYFYKILRKLNFPNYPLGGFDYFLISKKIRDIIIKMGQSDPFLQGEILYTGYKSKFILYDRKKRLKGRSKWTFSKKVKYFIDGILGYSFFPLRVITIAGFSIFILSIIFAFYIFISKILGYGTFPLGWTSLVILILILSSVQMMFLGVIGEYLWRVLSQTRNRPKYFIEKILD
jgi:glycosyltransferase involved in cell wall biosynthesis